MQKLAIIISHPIQYYAPWFRYLANYLNWDLKVFYLWNFGITQQIDQGFKTSICWDLPLLEGYNFEFVLNVSRHPGTHHFWGLNNPSLLARVSVYQPNVVLLMNYRYASCAQFLLRWNCTQAPLLFRGDSHRLIPSMGLKNEVKRQLIKKIFQRFAGCLYVGQANYQYFQYHGVPADRLFFSPHAVENERFMGQSVAGQADAIAWKQELGIPANHLVILFTGKFEPKKRPLDLLKAFLQANLSKVSLLFVGSGSLEQSLKATAAGHAHIYFAPFQNQTLMPRTYAAADLVVLPSYGSQETWGLVVNEAMCLARPIIVSNQVGCAQDLVHPYQNGLTFTAGDIDALTHSLQEACSNRERLRQWGQASLVRVSSYSYAQSTQGLRQALSFLCGVS
jgi:glycosyltransferase involved in cell wall biosynthesis